MRILFDQGTPVPIRRRLAGHTVNTAYECGWHQLTNGALIRTAEAHGYDLLLTTDQNLKYQQNLKNRKIAIVVLLSASWPKIRTRLDVIVQTVETVSPGGFAEIMI